MSSSRKLPVFSHTNVSGTLNTQTTTPSGDPNSLPLRQSEPMAHVPPSIALEWALARQQVNNRELRTLEVLQSELKSLKPQRSVYEKQGGVYFLKNREEIQANVLDRVATAQDEKASLAKAVLEANKKIAVGDDTPG